MANFGWESKILKYMKSLITDNLKEVYNIKQDRYEYVQEENEKYYK